MKPYDLIELQNQMNDDFRFVKFLLFLMASARNEYLPTDTMNEISHFLANRVEDIELMFDTFCEEVKTEPLQPVASNSQTLPTVEAWQIVRK